MGEIADMMLDGTLCTMCGEYLGSNNDYPTMCRGCQRQQEVDAAPPKARCKICKKKVKEVGLAQHMKDKHGRQI